MSEQPLSGDPGPSSPFAGAGSDPASSRGFDALPPGPVLSQPRSEPSAAATPPSPSGGAAAEPATDAGEAGSNTTGDDGRPRRKRGRRGGRGRRKASKSVGDADAQGDAGELEDASVSEGGDDGDASDEKPRSRRRGSRGGRRRKKGTAGADGSAQDADGDSASARSTRDADDTGDERDPEESGDAAASSDDGEAGDKPKRKRRSRRSRSRRSSSDESSDSEDENDTAGDQEASQGAGKKKRKRGSRGGRGRKKAIVEGAVGIEWLPGEDDDLPELSELPDDAVLVRGESEGGSRRKKKKREGKKAAGKKTKDAAPEPAKKRTILVNAADPEETRVAAIEEGRVVELTMSVKKHTSYVSDIYRGRVVNIESAIGAAFVDFGQGRNGFLHASDILPSYGDPEWSLDKLLSTPVDAEEEHDEDDHHDHDDDADDDDDDDASDDSSDESDSAGERTREKKDRGRRGRRGKPRPTRVRVPIDKLVKKGEMVAVQITKDAIGDKGPTLTTYVSIPGRYLVLMPSLERTGVSRKIEDEKERRRLKRILTSLEIPDGMGVIVRTAGIGKTKAELKRDLDYLFLAWDEFAKRLKSGRNPAPLYQESNVAIRTMRDMFTTETDAVIVDDKDVFERMTEFTRKLMPEHVDRIKLHDGPRPLFQSHGVEQDFEKIFSRRVELPSGGSIVIDQTEALVAIDVNSGRTREAGAEFEDIALKTNLEAAPEIARQIRLRDLGGIIVLDYIDMMRAASRRAVEKATRDALKYDRARSKVGRISQFGLLELTRQRLGPGLNKLVYDTCLMCRGSGRRRNASSRAQAILRRLGASIALKGFTTVEVRAHPDVIDYLNAHLSAELKSLEEKSGRSLVLLAMPDQLEDSVLHYLRADGREVRPGGRRKR